MKSLWTSILVLGLFPSLVFTAAAQDEKKYEGGEKDLLGTWVLKSMTGDPIFFVVSSVQGTLKKDGTFTTSISFVDLQSSSISGNYELTKDHHMKLFQKGNKTPYVIKYWFSDPGKTTLVVHDDSVGATITLNKKTKDSSSSGGGGGLF